VGRVVRQTATSHGYSLSLWSTAAVLADRQSRMPTPLEVCALNAGASASFAALAALQCRGMRGAAADTEAPVVTGAVHLPGVLLSCAAVASVDRLVAGPLAWAIAGAALTAVFVLGAAAQAWIGERLRRGAVEVLP
jgi:hypothetical protein